MIATEAQVRAATQLFDLTEQQRALVATLHRMVEGKVRDHLGYDPEQKPHTEFYPRVQLAATRDRGVWDVNSSHTTARFESFGEADTLQLRHLPVRAVTDLRVDEEGRHGTASGSFAASDAWTEGEDFWPEYEALYLCRSGMLRASGAWPATPGSVKVTYVAGYSRDELLGQATADSLSGGVYISSGVDASPIASSVQVAVVANYAKLLAWKPGELTGVAGALQSERLQDYSYTLAADALASLGFTVTLPTESLGYLEPYRHWGLLRL